MTSPQDQQRVPIERWRLWLGRVVLVPFVAMSGGMTFALYRVLASGEIHTVSRGYRSASSTYSFSDSPVMFVVSFAFYAALALFIIFVTVLVAKRVAKGAQPR